MVLVRCSVVSLLLVISLFPSAFAQEPAESTSVAIVTSLSGVSSVARAGGHDTNPVRFNDAVYPSDVIRTGENGAVRLLMGGKAVITVREFTTVSITGDPGKPAAI